MNGARGRKEERLYAAYFRRSRRTGLAERLFAFLFTLSCGYAASYMLDAAMRRDGGGLLRAGLIFLLLLAAGLPFMLFLSGRAGKARIRDRQELREELYRRMLGSRLNVSSFGERASFSGTYPTRRRSNTGRGCRKSSRDCA